MGVYEHYKAGFLPFSGGAAEQPNKAMQAIRLISHRMVKNELEKKARAKKSKG